MRPSARCVALLVAAPLVVPAGANAQDEWDRAAAAVVRLEPARFPDLPGAVRAELERLGCRVPQAFYPEEPHNVIRGNFARAGQEDWAVLCSRDGASEIRVFWGGPARCPSPIGEPSPDRDWLQGMGGAEIVYSRHIRAVGRDYILRMHEAFGGPEPPPIEHQGIEEYFVEKASSVLYCYQGKWVRLTGMD